MRQHRSEPPLATRTNPRCPVSDRARRVGQVAWDAVHNHGEHRRQTPNDDYLTAVGVAVLRAIDNEGERA